MGPVAHGDASGRGSPRVCRPPPMHVFLSGEDAGFAPAFARSPSFFSGQKYISQRILCEAAGVRGCGPTARGQAWPTSNHNPKRE
jgi:hypothetical protein